MATKKESAEKQAQKVEARLQLLEMLKPGDTVYTILRHVSSSGMSRSISLVIARGAEIVEIDWLVARLMSDTIDRKYGGIKISGCGMDMGFALVYELGRCLWPKGTDKPHGTRNGKPDSNGGYALQQRWL